MKVVHVPNSHLYHQHLIRALQAAGTDVDPHTWGWGTYLPDVVDEILETRAEIVHLHWPEALCRPAAPGLADRILRRLRLEERWGRGRPETAEALRRLRAHGRKLIWTMHNLAPHYAGGHAHTACHPLYQQFARLADGVVHHSRWGEQIARKTYAFRPECRHAVIHFGVFPDEAPAEWTKAMARHALGIPEDEMILLTVGAVGPRKHLDLLVQAVGTLEGIPCRLFVVGDGNTATMQQLTEQGKGRVQFLGKLDQPGLSRYARAADFLLFAPDRDQLTTGGPHTSESILRPQLTTETPYVKEVLGDAAIYYVPTPDGLQQALRHGHRLLTSASEQYDGMVSELAARRKAHSWAAAARNTAELYANVLASGIGAP